MDTSRKTALTDKEAADELRRLNRAEQVKLKLKNENCVSSNAFAEILLEEGKDLLETLKNNSFMMSSMADSLSGKSSELLDDNKSFDGIDRRVALLFKKTEHPPPNLTKHPHPQLSKC